MQGGQYGLFDNVEDNLTLAPFQTFDFEGLDKYLQLLEPLLFYVLHRANASIYHAALATTFKLFLLDEARRFLKTPRIKDLHRRGAEDVPVAECGHDPGNAIERRSDAQ